ncbi:MAG TPA: LysM peptidoglycan-binding domain-containing protein [Myxococcales bacterium]|nr:LysM peptidoglycan-binding domain-containing protein [Myxococcales bacterium]
MKSYWIIVLGLILVAGACADDAVIEETKEWYKPWYAESNGEGIEQSPEELLLMKNGSSNSEMGDDEEILLVEGTVMLELDPDSDNTEDARIVTIEIQRGETLRLYEKWSGIPRDELKALNEMKKRRGLRIGKSFKLMLSPDEWRSFKEAREDHFTSLEKAFFAKNEVVRLDRYKVHRGDNIWKISKLHNRVPVWLLEKFNTNMNLSKLKIGEELLVPVLQDLAGENDANAAATLWKTENNGRNGRVAQLNQIRIARPALKQAGTMKAQTSIPSQVQPIQAPAEPQGLTLKVAKNETLGHYSRWSGVRVSKIVEVNPGINPNRLRLSQRLRVPVADNRIANFYDRRRRFNGTPPPARISPVKVTKAVAVDKPAPRAKKPALQTADLHALAAKSKADKKKIKPTYGTHTVSQGESGWLIAKKLYKISLKQLRHANPNVNLDRLKIGQLLRIPKSL